MGPAYYISQQNPPDAPLTPTDLPAPAEPGLPPTPPAAPVREPPPATDLPPGSIPSPLRL
jgi:hypothetical protein